MKTIETQITISPDKRLTLDVEVDVAPGKYQVIVVLEEKRYPKHGALNLPVHHVKSWPKDLSLRREDLYDDRV